MASDPIQQNHIVSPVSLEEQVAQSVSGFLFVSSVQSATKANEPARTET